MRGEVGDFTSQLFLAILNLKVKCKLDYFIYLQSVNGFNLVLNMFKETKGNKINKK